MRGPCAPPTWPRRPAAAVSSTHQVYQRSTRSRARGVWRHPERGDSGTSDPSRIFRALGACPCSPRLTGRGPARADCSVLWLPGAPPPRRRPDGFFHDCIRPRPPLFPPSLACPRAGVFPGLNWSMEEPPPRSSLEPQEPSPSTHSSVPQSYPCPQGFWPQPHD